MLIWLRKKKEKKKKKRKIQYDVVDNWNIYKH